MMATWQGGVAREEEGRRQGRTDERARSTSHSFSRVRARAAGSRHEIRT